VPELREARKNPYMDACWVLPNVVVASAIEEAPVDVERYHEEGVLPHQRGQKILGASEVPWDCDTGAGWKEG